MDNRFAFLRIQNVKTRKNSCASLIIATRKNVENGDDFGTYFVNSRTIKVTKQYLQIHLFFRLTNFFGLSPPLGLTTTNPVSHITITFGYNDEGYAETVTFIKPSTIRAWPPLFHGEIREELS